MRATIWEEGGAQGRGQEEREGGGEGGRRGETDIVLSKAFVSQERTKEIIFFIDCI
jgi:hypothetical protein